VLLVLSYEKRAAMRFIGHKKKECLILLGKPSLKTMHYLANIGRNAQQAMTTRTTLYKTSTNQEARVQGTEL
jgi:hypothetical protein